MVTSFWQVPFLWLGISCIFAPASGAQPASRNIKVAYPAISSIMGGLWMAKEIQAFEKYGLHSELVYLPSGPVAVSALLAGDLTMAFAATNAAIASGIFEVTRYLGLWRVDMLLRTVLKICNFGVRVNL